MHSSGVACRLTPHLMHPAEATHLGARAASCAGVPRPKSGRRAEPTAVLPRCTQSRRGHFRMGRSDDYRRYAKDCLDMASTVQDAKSRASLLQMAQVWLRLAQTHDAKRQPDKRQSEKRQSDHGGE
jgi:hypothetical protein